MARKPRTEFSIYRTYSVPAFTAGEISHSCGIWAGTVSQIAEALGTDRATVFSLVSSGAVSAFTTSGASWHPMASMSFTNAQYERLRLLIPRNN